MHCKWPVSEYINTIIRKEKHISTTVENIFLSITDVADESLA